MEESVAKKECDRRLECDGLLYDNSNGQFVMRKGMELNKEFYENPSSTNTFCVEEINCDPKTTILKDGVCVAKSNTNNEVMTWPLLIFKLAMASK